MKNKLFLVALATVTVLGPSLATPHHQTVHASDVTLTETCDKNGTVYVGYENVDGEVCKLTADGKGTICVGYENRDTEESEASSTKNDCSNWFWCFLNYLWTTIKSWVS